MTVLKNYDVIKKSRDLGYYFFIILDILYSATFMQSFIAKAVVEGLGLCPLTKMLFNVKKAQSD